jgi:hypothetical protein
MWEVIKVKGYLREGMPAAVDSRFVGDLEFTAITIKKLAPID